VPIPSLLGLFLLIILFLFSELSSVTGQIDLSESCRPQAVAPSVWTLVKYAQGLPSPMPGTDKEAQHFSMSHGE
jgi:hypothetical protein